MELSRVTGVRSQRLDGAVEKVGTLGEEDMWMQDDT
jgi:hypothetical protein